MNHRKRIIYFLLTGLLWAPVQAWAIGGDGEGNGDCPKKKKEAAKARVEQQEAEEIDIYESENKNFGSDFQMLEYRNEERRALPATKETKQPERKTASGEVEEDDGSAMSFNFIYYLIDKFKFTDPLN